MSVLYGFDLLFPRPRLAGAIAALARRADPEGFAGCTLVLPDGAALPTPFDAQSEDGPLERFEVGRSEPFQWLDTSLWLPVDARVREFIGRHGAQPPTRSSPRGLEVSIGLISVHVHAGERFALVRLGAVASSMSHMFEESAAVRGAVQSLLAEAGGLVALLSRQPGEPIEPLDRPGVSLRIEEPDEFDDPTALDRFADAVLLALRDRSAER